MKNKKGFTLIELLGVIILLAVVLTIAVTAYSRYLNSAKNKTFKIAEKNFQTAAKSAYADCFEDSTNNSFCQYHGELDSKYTYQIVYLKELIDNTYIDEIKSPYDTDQMCDSSLSYVYVSNKSAPTANNKDMVYEACLVCGDHKSESCRDDIDLEAPTFGTTCTAYYDAVGGPLYDGSWTDRDVYLVFGATGNYRYGIDEFSYSINDGSSTKIDSNKTTNTATLHLNKTVGNKVYKVQAIDGMNGKGSIVSCGANIKIDKGTISRVSLSAKTTSGESVESGNWVSEKVVLSAAVTPSNSTSGYLYQWYKDGEKFGSQTSSPNLTVDGIGTYKVEVTNQVGKIKAFSENEFVVKSDPVKPKVELVISDGILSGKWHSSKFTIGYKKVKNVSGNNYYYGTKSNPTDKWTSLSIDTDSKTSSGTTYYFKICSGVGLCDEVTYVAKLDTFTPEKIGTPVLAATDGIGSGSWHKAKTTLTASGSSSVSGITYYLDTNKNPSTKQSSKEIVDNTTASGTTYYAKACNGAGTCSGVSNYVLKIDKTSPTCNVYVSSGTKVDNNWYTSKVDLAVKVSNESSIISGVSSKKLSQTSVTTNTTGQKVTATVTSGSGITVDCTPITVKLDNKTPATPKLTATDGIGSGSWHKAKTTLTASGSSSVSGITYYLDTNKNPSTKQSSKEIVDNTTASGTTYYAKACNGAGTCSGVSNYVLKIDTVTPPTPSLAISDNIGSNNWHNKDFNITSSGGNNISGNTYHYGTSVAANSINSNKAPFSDNTTAVTYYFKVCSGAGLCSEIPANYVVKLDKSVPTVTAKNASNYITTTTGASITSYFNITGVISGNTTVCKVGSTTVTNTNNLGLGTNTVTCTSTSGSGLSSSASTVFKHQYVATATCPSGYTLSDGQCIKKVVTGYTCPSGGSLNGSICYTSSKYDADTSCPSGYTKEGTQCSKSVFSHYSCPNGGSLDGSKCNTSYDATCSLYGCYLYNKCTVCTCTNKTTGHSYSDELVTTQKQFESDCGSSYGVLNFEVSCTYGRSSKCSGSEYNTGDVCEGKNSKRCDTYSCPNGGTLNTADNKCYNNYDASPNYTTDTQNVTYSCPQGGDLSGTICIISGSYDATPVTKEDAVGIIYTCPSGGSNNTNQTTCSF